MMIQDIMPCKLHNAFQQRKAGRENICFTFKKGKLLTWQRENGSIALPTFEQLGGDFEERQKKAVYAFSIDEEPMFLLLERDFNGELPEGLSYRELHSLYQAEQRWETMAGVTAGHLNRWYEEHLYCGCCGGKMDFSHQERAMVCPACGNVQYPRISPVVMAAVTDGERLLVTRYAGRPYKGLALIAGFVEIGESLEEALRREVMEEVGLRVKELRYFASQPWGFSDSVISGFFARLDGSGEIRLDRDELSEAVWLSKDEIPAQNTGVSITAEMIEAFRTGNIKD